ncbi:sensor histidine kinase, partial [Bacteroidota bacterium]
IRTPLNAIIGMSDLLLLENPPKEQLEALNAIKFSGEHLLVLVNDILDISKIEEGKINIENISFDLNQFIKSVEKAFSYQMKKGLI